MIKINGMTKKLKPVNKSGFVERGYEGELKENVDPGVSEATHGARFSLGDSHQMGALSFVPEKQVTLHRMVPATTGK